METETEETFYYTKFPLDGKTPEPISMYQQKHGYCPRVIVVNPVNWQSEDISSYVVRVLVNNLVSAALTGDPPALRTMKCTVQITEDDSVDLDQLICRGKAKPEEW